MKIIAKREAILSPLQAVIGVVERKQTMPILANVLVAAKGGKLSITATDLEVELVARSRRAGPCAYARLRVDPAKARPLLNGANVAPLSIALREINDDLLTCGSPFQHTADRLCHDGAAELHDDARHVVYSAFSFT